MNIKRKSSEPSLKSLEDNDLIIYLKSSNKLFKLLIKDKVIFLLIFNDNI
jgi:hypothetical protein